MENPDVNFYHLKRCKKHGHVSHACLYWRDLESICAPCNQLLVGLNNCTEVRWVPNDPPLPDPEIETQPLLLGNLNSCSFCEAQMVKIGLWKELVQSMVD